MAKKINAKKTGDAEEVLPVKIKKDFDLDSHESLIPDKIVEDPEVLEETEESAELGDEMELDEEELNPFKDKWEE